MRKCLILTLVTALFAMGSMASDWSANNGNSAKGIAPTFSVGHALSTRRAIAKSDKTPIKPINTARQKAAKNTNIVRQAAPSIMRSADHSSALFFESFESCKHGKNTLPTGWTNISKGDKVLGEEDKWIGFSKAYADYYMFAPPIDGEMMIGIYYNDDDEKDEWLTSPSVTIPTQGYELSFYWYTKPYFLYIIDRYHVDFDNGVFTDREVTSNFQALIKTDTDTEWTVIFDLEKKYSSVEYAELAETDFDEMQQVTFNLDQYVGKNVQFAFRYFGIEGNTLTLDAIGVDKPNVEAHYTPHYSRLFFGYSPDDIVQWMPASIEFYPVNHYIYWENTSPVKDNMLFDWTYFTLNDLGGVMEQYDNDPDMLSIMYTPDYSTDATLRNNFYPMPRLNARAIGGGSGNYTHWANFLQAGGTTEFDFGPDPDPLDEYEEGGYAKFTATNFDLPTHGYGVHFEEDEQLGFLAEPIFGKTVNTDAWWEHYSYPNGNPNGKYAYVDGFANLFIPHPEATLMVKGVTAWGLGTIADDAEFTMNIYTMKGDILVEKPIATKKILGKDIIQIPSGMTRNYLIMNFPLDQEIEFSADGTDYGYMVEVNGYHNDKVEWFAPVQSINPHEEGWNFAFYRYRSPDYSSINQEISYVGYFKNHNGLDLETSFAIGLDAYYPWLQYAPGQSDVIIDNNNHSFDIQGYFDAKEYTVKAPEWLDVNLSGRYTTHVDVNVNTPDPETRHAAITFSAPGVKDLSVDITVAGSGAVADIITDDNTLAPVYNLQGIKVMDNASDTDIQNLPAGLYIHRARKVAVK